MPRTNNLSTSQSFKNDRTIYSWDLRTSGWDFHQVDGINFEKSGSFRISFQTDTPVIENYFVSVIGMTTGLIVIDGSRCG